MEQDNAPQVPANVPVMTLERFAQLSGLTEDVVRGQIQKGNLPLFKIGRRRMVNVALLYAECLQAEDWV